MLPQKLLLPMAILMPAWLIVGRALLGSVGWLTIIYAVLIGPAVFWFFIIIYFLTRKRTLDYINKLLLVALYVSLFLHGLFVVDGGDTTESVGSVISRWFGESVEGFSNTMGFLLFGVSFLLAVALLSRIIIKRFTKKPDSITS